MDFIVEDGVLRKYCGRKGHIVIPDGVTEIDSCAFERNKRLRSVIIPESVKKIGAFAFLACENLKKVVLPSGLEEIGIGAFMTCKSLESINIPEHVEFEDQMFFGCDSLADEMGFVIVKGILQYYCGENKNVVVPENVIRVTGKAFQDCFTLESIEFANPETKVDEDAFWGCLGMRDKDGFVIVRDVLYFYFGEEPNVVVPDGTVEIESFVFNMYRGELPEMESVFVPSSVTKIGEEAFGEQCKIRTVKGSYAEQYAKENGIPVIVE